jgi:hypothetical protein
LRTQVVLAHLAPYAGIVVETPNPGPGRRVLTDDSASSAKPELPAFLARPPGAPVYHGFPLLEESETDGWRLGVISAFDEEPEGCDGGDAYVVAPDGSRAGLVWASGNFATHEICPPDSERWGVYGIAFPRAVRSLADLVECFRAVLPELKQIHGRTRRSKEPSFLEVRVTHAPLAVIYRLFKPTIEIDGRKERRSWGRHRFQISPGRYVVSVSYPWLFSPECGKNSVECELGPGETRRITYRAGLIRYLPGRISVD